MIDDTHALTLAQRALILAKIFQAIPLYFAHWQDSELARDGLDAAFADLVEAALPCESRKRFSLLVMAFLARFNNAHTRLFDPYLETLPPVGMALRPVEGRWTAVRSGYPGLTPGDVILRIEDRSADDWYAELRAYAFGSPQARTIQFDALLGAFLPERYCLQIEGADGAPRTLTVDRAALRAGTAIQARAAAEAAEGRWLTDDLAMIRVPSFMQPEAEQRARACVEEFSGASALIVDVRDNHGGSTPGGLISHLMDRPYRWWAESSPLTVGLLAVQAQRGGDAIFRSAHLQWPASVSDPEPSGYKGKLFLLVDRGTLSAAEDFTMPFKDNGRAVIVGETTGGSTGQPFMHTFEQGILLAVGTKRATMPDGTPFEGIGIAPDVLVEVRREDLYAGRDPVLERAIALARA